MTMDRTMGAGEFKAKCLALLDDVASGRSAPITITKHGKPVARIVTVKPWKKRKSMKGSVVQLVGDDELTKPIDDPWSVDP